MTYLKKTDQSPWEAGIPSSMKDDLFVYCCVSVILTFNTSNVLYTKWHLNDSNQDMSLLVTNIGRTHLMSIDNFKTSDLILKS